MHTRLHQGAHVCAHVCIYIYICMYTCIYRYMYTCIYIYVHTNIYTYILCIYIIRSYNGSTYTLNTYIHIREHKYSHTHTHIHYVCRYVYSHGIGVKPWFSGASGFCSYRQVYAPLARWRPSQRHPTFQNSPKAPYILLPSPLFS